MTSSRPGRNSPCPCGSGRKFKRCCALTASPNAVSTRLTHDRSATLLRHLAGARPGTPKRSWRRRLCSPDASHRGASSRQPKRTAAAHSVTARFFVDVGLALARSNRLEEALTNFAYAVDLDPDLAHAHFYVGVALLNMGREGAALAPLKRAASMAPHVAEFQRMLGGLLGDWGWSKDAAAAFRAAAAAAPSPVQALSDTASAMRYEGRREKAKALLLRARALDPSDLGIRTMVGRMYSEEGRFSEAEQELRSVLARDPGHAAAAYELFQIVKVCAADRPLLAELASQATRPEVPPPARMMFGFALGRAYDQLGEYAEAIRHFERANAIRAATAPLDRAALVRDTERVIGAFPVGSLSTGVAAPREADERAVFIVGLPRSGTTLIEQVLSSHPRVTAGGEIEFWSVHSPSALDAGGSEAAVAPLAVAYRALLDRIDPKAARIVDKNPFNFLRLGLLRRALPRARIIHVRRTPIDNALSLYTTYFSGRYNYFYGNREDLLFYYDQYVRLMNHWRSVLPADRFLEIEYEALVEDREAQTRRLVEFCGLEWDEACLRPERNDRVVATASLWQVRQPVYRGAIGRWRNYAPWLGPLMRLAPPPGQSSGGPPGESAGTLDG